MYGLAQAAGFNPVITSTRRTYQEQQKLAARAAAGRSRYPAAQPGHSLHEQGLAFDMTVDDRRNLATLGRIWRMWGGRWGGGFGDPIHFDTGLRRR